MSLACKTSVMSSLIHEHPTQLNINFMAKKAKNIPLTQEEINRRNRMKRRFLWLLIILDVLFVAYLIYQIVIIAI